MHSHFTGARRPTDSSICDPIASINDWAIPFSGGENTTLGVIATNALLNKQDCTKVAQMAHDGLARTIIPAHTQVDGDILFAISTGENTTAIEPLKIGVCAADVMAHAVIQSMQ